MTFEPYNFIKYLPSMGIGMLTIFIIIAVIILVTIVINKVFKNKQ